MRPSRFAVSWANKLSGCPKDGSAQGVCHCWGRFVFHIAKGSVPRSPQSLQTFARIVGAYMSWPGFHKEFCRTVPKFALRS